MVNPRFKAQTLGSGPNVIEFWLDYVCPFSKKSFETVYKQLAPAAEKKFPGKFTFVFQHQPQPWHGQGSYLHEAGIAVSQIDPSKFWDFSDKLFAESEKFYDVYAVDKTRQQIIDELAELADKVGVDKKEFLRLTSIDRKGEFKNPGSPVSNDLKYFVKVGRQNGIHVSPTVLVNGLEDGSISSSWTLDQWTEKLQSIVSAADAKI